MVFRKKHNFLLARIKTRNYVESIIINIKKSSFSIHIKIW